MSMGNWTPNEEKIRPGMYNRFISTAMSRIKSGASGIVGMPIRADWGPIGEIVDITAENEIKTAFGESGDNCTTYLLNRCLLGGTKYKPKKIVAYRMATSSAAKATAIISGSLTLSAKYEGVRGNNFKYAIIKNIIDETKIDFKLYEDSELLATYTVAPDDIEGLVTSINNSDGLIEAKKTGDTELKVTTSTSFTGGNSGTNIAADDYMKALDALEPILINTLVLDGVTDSSILASVKSWVSRVRENGKEVIFVMGGSTEDDKDVTVGNKRSTDANNKAIVNVIVGTKNATRSFNSAETACQVAGLIAGTPITASTTYKQLEDVADVTVALSDTQIKQALKSGSFILVRDVDPETYSISIKVEQGINTLTTYGENESEKFSKIKCIRTLDTIDYDTGYWAAKNVIGELNNNDDGRAALISGIKAYLETLANSGAISTDFLTEVDSAFVSEGDTVYLNTQALTVDKIEKIFNSIYV